MPINDIKESPNFTSDISMFCDTSTHKAGANSLNLRHLGLINKCADSLYYVKDQKLICFVNGSEEIVADNCIGNINVVDARIIYCSSNGIQVFNTTQKTHEVICQSVPSTMLVIDDTVYYTDGIESGKLYSLSMSNKQMHIIDTSVESAFIDYFNDVLYYAKSYANAYTLYSLTKSHDSAKVAELTAAPLKIVSDSNVLCNNGKVYSLVDNTVYTDISLNAGESDSINAYENILYYIKNGKLCRYNLISGDLSEICNMQNNAAIYILVTDIYSVEVVNQEYTLVCSIDSNGSVLVLSSP